MTLTHDDIKALTAPFDEKTLGVKPQSVKGSRVMLVCYLQHTDVAARLDSVDPAWSAIITDERAASPEGSIIRMRITLKGVTREGVGDGNDSKSAASDALKRTAMLFGVGRYLYDSETVWAPYNEQTDKYKQWTYADYKASLKVGQAPLPTASTLATAGIKGVVINKVEGISLTGLPRAQIGKMIDELAASINLKEQAMTDWIEERYKKTSFTQLTTKEMIEFHGVLEGEKAAKQERFL